MRVGQFHYISAVYKGYGHSPYLIVSDYWMKRLIIVSILVIALGIWLSMAESFLFDFYQESTAERWANIASIPFLTLLLIILTRDRWKSSLKEGNKRLVQTIKYAGEGIIGTWLFYYFLLVPAISGTLLLFNAYVGEQSSFQVTGTVIDKTAFSMQRGAKYELQILTETGELTLESNGIATKPYEVGSRFELTLERGSLGLVTKRKTNR